MKKSNAKTSLKITMQPDGGADIELKYDDRDSEHRIEASHRIIAELQKLTDYDWLAALTLPYFSETYCSKCDHLYDGCKPYFDEKNPVPFPYCFKEKDSEAKT